MLEALVEVADLEDDFVKLTPRRDATASVGHRAYMYACVVAVSELCLV